ncbi:MAG: DUF2177 family protein [Pseudomonadota bacterium]
MEYAAAYLASLLLFLIIDLAWIKTVMRPIFERSLGDFLLPDPHIGAALAFFLLYQAGLLYFAVIPAVAAESWSLAALHGVLLAIIAYGTYETTNLATLRGWTLKMAAIDVAWGCTISAISAVAGYFVLTSLA